MEQLAGCSQGDPTRTTAKAAKEPMGQQTALRVGLAAVTSQEHLVPLTPPLQYPQFRIMGSKHRLLPWLHQVFSELDFDTAMDAFSGSGCVAYSLKAMGKSVVANDFLRFAYHLANGLIVNPGVQLSRTDIDSLLEDDAGAERFIERTFNGIFFTSEDLRFLDNTWANLGKIRDPYQQ